jgi:hypothetical protein
LALTAGFFADLALSTGFFAADGLAAPLAAGVAGLRWGALDLAGGLATAAGGLPATGFGAAFAAVALDPACLAAVVLSAGLAKLLPGVA